jgi:GxxExxY protein
MINAEGAEEREGKSLDRISHEVIGAAMKVHSALGPGLLESAYEACLAHELRKRGYLLATQVPLPVHYDGMVLELGYRIDMLVERSVLVELKAIENVLPVHKAQLLSYLRLSKKKLGLLINFHTLHLKDGITRLVNGH